MLEILKNRFNENMDRHPNLEWEVVESRLKDNASALKALRYMEKTAASPIRSALTKPEISSSSVTVPRNLPPPAEACATMMRLCKSERRIRRQAARNGWRRKWASSF